MPLPPAAPDRPADVARRCGRDQHGLVTRRQLAATGVTPAAVAHMLSTGHLRSVGRGVFAVGHMPLTRVGQLHAATLAVGSDAAIAGMAALEHWGASRWRSRLPEILAARRHRPRAGAVVRSASWFEPERHAVEHGGAVILSPEIALLDASRVLSPFQAAWALHELLHARRTTLRSVQDVAFVELRSARGAAVLRSAVELHVARCRGTRSGWEDGFLRALWRAGVPAPHVNWGVPVRGAFVEVDCAWPGVMLCAEVDGPGHDLLTQRRIDAERDAGLDAIGMRVLRTTPDWFEATVSAILDHFVAPHRTAMAPTPPAFLAAWRLMGTHVRAYDAGAA